MTVIPRLFARPRIKSRVEAPHFCPCLVLAPHNKAECRVPAHLTFQRPLSLDSQMAKQRKLEAQLRVEIHENILQKLSTQKQPTPAANKNKPRPERESCPHPGSFLSAHQWSVAVASPLELYSEEELYPPDNATINNDVTAKAKAKAKGAKSPQQQGDKPQLQFVSKHHEQPPVCFRKLESCLESKDWPRLKSLLLKSYKAKRTIDSDVLARIISSMWAANKLELITWTFERFESGLESDRDSLIRVIQSAFREGNFQLCEYVAEKHSNMLENNPTVIDCMLRSFLKVRDFTFAKAYLDQVWSHVSDATILTYIQTSAKYARDARELERAFFAWHKRDLQLHSSLHSQSNSSDSTNNIKKESIYVATLNGLLDLDFFNFSAFKAVLDAYRDRLAPGQRKVLPLEITQVLMYRALINNDSRLALDLALELLETQASSHAQPTSLRDILNQPFARAGVYFAWHKNISKLQWLLDTMAEMSLTLETSYANDLLEALSRFPRFKLVDALYLFERHNIVGSMQTVQSLFALLIKQNPEAAYKFYSSLKPSSMSQDEKNTLELQFGWRKKQALKADLPSLRAAVLPSEISSILETLARNGRSVPLPLLLDAGMAAARSADASLLSKITEIIEKRADSRAASAVKVKVAFLELVAAVETLKADGLEISLQSRKPRIARLLGDFITTFGLHSHLGIKQRTYIGQQFSYCGDYRRAVAVLDSMRCQPQTLSEHPGFDHSVTAKRAPISLLNHDSTSLACMCKALSHCNQFSSLIRLLEMIALPTTDFNLDATFFSALRKCRAHIIETARKFKTQPHPLLERFDSLVDQLRTNNAAQTNRDIETAYDLSRLAQKWGFHLTKR